MRNTWPMVPLGEVLKPISRPETVDASKTYSLLGARWYALGLYIKDVLPGSSIRASRVYRVEEGDFVYNRLFAWKGSFALASKDNHACYVSNEFPCFQVNRLRLDGMYLWRYLSQEAAWTEALGLSTGGTPTSRNRLKEEKLLAMTIPLPPLPDQRRIVAKIDELAAKIEEARGLRQRGRDEADRFAAAEASRMFISLVKDYPVRAFGDFQPHVTSGPRNWGQRYVEGGELRFYRAQDILPEGKLAADNKGFIARPETQQGATAQLRAGDLMIVITGATVGRVAVYPDHAEPGYVSQHVAICRLPSSDFDGRYALWGLLNAEGQAQLLGQRYGQGKPGLNLSNIRALSLPVPPLSEQRRIVAHLDDLQAKVDRLKDLQAKTAAELDALLPSILDKAFKGEL